MRRPTDRQTGLLVAGALATAMMIAPALARAATPPVAPASPPAAPGPNGGKDASKEASKGSAFAGGLDFGSSREPIAITADQLDFDYQKNRVTYRGTVHATQGELQIDCDTLIVNFDPADDQKQAQLREVIAQGNVVIVQGTRRATGATAVFSQTQRQIVLIGDPVLHDGPNEVSGDRIIVYVDEGRSIVESSAKKRVSAVLYPGSTSGGVGAAHSGDAAAASTTRKAP